MRYSLGIQPALTVSKPERKHLLRLGKSHMVRIMNAQVYTRAWVVVLLAAVHPCATVISGRRAHSCKS